MTMLPARGATLTEYAKSYAGYLRKASMPFSERNSLLSILPAVENGSAPSCLMCKFARFISEVKKSVSGLPVRPEPCQRGTLPATCLVDDLILWLH